MFDALIKIISQYFGLIIFAAIFLFIVFLVLFALYHLARKNRDYESHAGGMWGSINVVHQFLDPSQRNMVEVRQYEEEKEDSEEEGDPHDK